MEKDIEHIQVTFRLLEVDKQQKPMACPYVMLGM